MIHPLLDFKVAGSRDAKGLFQFPEKVALQCPLRRMQSKRPTRLAISMSTMRPTMPNKTKVVIDAEADEATDAVEAVNIRSPNIVAFSHI
jgi:hypothetical protein